MIAILIILLVSLAGFFILWLIHISVSYSWKHHERIQYSEFIDFVEYCPTAVATLKYSDPYIEEGTKIWGMTMMPMMYAYYTYWYLFKRASVLKVTETKLFGRAPWIKESLDDR